MGTCFQWLVYRVNYYMRLVSKKCCGRVWILAPINKPQKGNRPKHSKNFIPTVICNASSKNLHNIPHCKHTTWNLTQQLLNILHLIQNGDVVSEGTINVLGFKTISSIWKELI